MKRGIKNYIAIACVGVACFACSLDPQSAGISRITYFPDFIMEGAPTLFLQVGENFTDPGVSAEEGGKSIEVQVSTLGNYFAGNVTTIDTNIPDRYSITYSAINSDGFPGSVGREVFVAGKGNLLDDISGLYTATVVRDGVVAAQYTDMAYVIIRKTGPSTYLLSDIIGGYYDLGRSFGPDYAGPSSTITVNDLGANDFTFGPSVGIGLFGGSAEITEMQVNSGNKQIHLITEWDLGFTFDVTLTQVDF